MLHCAVSSQAMVLSGPRLILQLAPSLHVAVELAPALRSQLESASHVMTLSSLPFPLHSDVSWHSSVSAPFEFPLHFAAVVQSREQASDPHSAWQSVPAAQVHEASAQEQPAPLQVGAALLSLPQPAKLRASATPSGSQATLIEGYRARRLWVEVLRLGGDTVRATARMVPVMMDLLSGPTAPRYIQHSWPRAGRRQARRGPLGSFRVRLTLAGVERLELFERTPSPCARSRG